MKNTSLAKDSWVALRALTPARIALGRAGAGMPTKAALDFQLAHARARDAVHAAFDPQRLREELKVLGCDALLVSSAAPDSKTFLLRPDLGRRLGDDGREILKSEAAKRERNGDTMFDLAIIVSDGLSALAAHRQVAPLMCELLSQLRQPQGATATESWRLAPIVIAQRGRVAIEDEIGELLGARLALILIGERPGLGSPDSLGAYLVHGPRIGNTDAHRNCVSNIRPEGLGHAAAARTIHYLLTQARRHQISGVGLKDNSRLLGNE